MTISTDPAAPLVVVVGSSGKQGGSVLRNLIASDKPYRLRGFTRDVSKSVARDFKALGVEIVSVNIVVGNEAAVREAFHGADIVFGVTDFWEHKDTNREVAEGKLMADAAKAVGAKLFVFSGLPDATKLSGGKLTHIQHYDGKAHVVEYARGILPTVDVQAGYYMTNLTNPLVTPLKQDDGTYLWELYGDLVQPYVDTEHDYGLFVRYAIESPEYNKGGGTIYTYGEHLRGTEAAAVLERERGIKIKFANLPREAFVAKMKGFEFPPEFILDYAECLIDMTAEYGYYFGQEFSPDQQKVRAGLARKPRTFAEFLKANPKFFRV